MFSSSSLDDFLISHYLLNYSVDLTENPYFLVFTTDVFRDLKVGVLNAPGFYWRNESSVKEGPRRCSLMINCILIVPGRKKMG